MSLEPILRAMVQSDQDMRAALDTTMEAVDGWDWGWLLRKKKLPTINHWLGGFLKYTATHNLWMV